MYIYIYIHTCIYIYTYVYIYINIVIVSCSSCFGYVSWIHFSQLNYLLTRRGAKLEHQGAAGRRGLMGGTCRSDPTPKCCTFWLENP